MDSVKGMMKLKIGNVEKKLEGLNGLNKIEKKVEEQNKKLEEQNTKLEGQNKMMKMMMKEQNTKLEGQNKVMEMMMSKIEELLLCQQRPETGVTHLIGGSGPEIQAEG
jgi:hypothetical protein